MTVEEIKQKCDNKESVNISTPEDYNNMILYLISNGSWDKNKGYRIFNIVNDIDFNGGNIELMYQDTNAYFIELNGNKFSIKNGKCIDLLARNRCLISVWDSKLNKLSYESCNLNVWYLEILKVIGDNSSVDYFNFENNLIETINGYQFIGGSSFPANNISSNSKIRTGGAYRGIVGANVLFAANLDEVNFSKENTGYYLSERWNNIDMYRSTIRYFYARPKIVLTTGLGIFRIFDKLGDNSTQCYFAPLITDVTKLPNVLELTRTDLKDTYYEEEAFSDYIGTKNGNSIPSEDLHNLSIMRARGWNA